jgi:hypothetical protein
MLLLGYEFKSPLSILGTESGFVMTVVDALPDLDTISSEVDV